MGNQLEIKTKFEHFINEISETNDVNENFLKHEIESFRKQTSISSIDSFKGLGDIFLECLGNLNGQLLTNMIENLIVIIQLDTNDLENFTLALDLLMLIVDHKLDSWSEISNLIIENFLSVRGSKNSSIKDFFPVNLLTYALNTFLDEDLINSVYSKERERVKFKFYLLKVIRVVLYLGFKQGKEPQIIDSIQHIDVYKFILLSESFNILSKSKIESFLKRLLNALLQGLNDFDSYVESSYYYPHYEQYIREVTQILMYFILDTNSDFFKPLLNSVDKNDEIQFVFENRFNEQCFKFLKDSISEYTQEKDSNILTTIMSDIQTQKDFIKVSLLDESTFKLNRVKNLLNVMFKYSSKINQNLVLSLKFLVLYLFENSSDLIESLLLQREFTNELVRHLISSRHECMYITKDDKRTFKETAVNRNENILRILDMAIMNKISCTQNLYIMLNYLTKSKPNFYKLPSFSSIGIQTHRIEDIIDHYLNSVLFCFESYIASTYEAKNSLHYSLKRQDLQMFLSLMNLSNLTLKTDSEITMKSPLGKSLSQVVKKFTAFLPSSENYNEFVLLSFQMIRIVGNLLYIADSPSELLVMLMKSNLVSLLDRVKKIMEEYLITSGRLVKKYEEIESCVGFIRGNLSRVSCELEREGLSCEFSDEMTVTVLI